MTSSCARAVPWHAVVQFHRQVARRAERASFALPVAESACERWSSLTGFEPEQLAGPWELDPEALESRHLRRDARTGMDEAFIGGPCWYRWKPAADQGRHLEWIPLVYREVRVEERDDRLRIVPVHEGWDICPLVLQFLEQRNVQTAAPLDEMLPDLLSAAESKAAEDGRGLSSTLVDAFLQAAPELGEVLAQARDDLPVDQLDFVPSPWVLFTVSAGRSAATQSIRRDYDELERHVAASPKDIGGLVLLEDASGAPARAVREIPPVVPLNDLQRSAVEAALNGRPVTVVSAPPGCGKSRVILSILVNAWASSTSVLFASHSPRAIDTLRQRLKTFESDVEIAIGADGEHPENIPEALGRTLELVTARRGESYYGGSPSVRKRQQLVKKKQLLRQLLDDQVPKRVNQAIRAALESYAMRRRALSTLESRREELASKLRDLGVEGEPDTFDEQILDPLREWRSGIRATRRLIEEDAHRQARLQGELSAARADRDTVLADCQVDSPSDQDTSWLLAEPGFVSFEQALTALSDKLRDPIEEDHGDDTAWDEAYDAWSSSEEAAEWERKARELASLLRPAGIALKEKAEELRAARDALETAQRNVQNATKTSSLDVRREDLDAWAASYQELCALPRSKLALRHRSRSAELVRQLEEIERRFRSTFPAHIWAGIGALDESGRARLSTVVERAREWIGARERWERLSPVRDEIEAESDALRRRLAALGMDSPSTEVTPAACAAIASELNAKASVAASAAAAWSKREARERLPAEVIELAAQIRAAGAGTPIKERWMNGAGAPLMAALDALAGDPGIEKVSAVRRELLASLEADPVLENWRRAYEAEKQAAEIAEQLERIPARSARFSHWKSRRPPSLPPALGVEGAFDDDDSHPVWTFLKACEEWSQSRAAFRDEEAPALERTASAEGATAVQRMGEAAKALPKGKERAWLESLASGPESSEPWPIEEVAEKAALWRPERLQAAMKRIDAQLERIAFETAKERWLERATLDGEALRSLDALRDHYACNPQGIEKDGYPHFERSLKVQPVWAATPTSSQLIPLQPGLFDLVVIDDATKCNLTDVLPLLFRAKRLVVIGDPEQPPLADSLGAQAQRTLAARFGVDGWAELFGHVGNDVYKAAVGNLPGRKVEEISLVEGE